MRKQINWEEIYRAYIFGIEKDGKFEFPTLKDLAELYHIAVITVLTHSAKEKWTEARENYLKERRQKTKQKIVDKFSEEEFDFDSQLLDKAKKIIEKLDIVIENPENANRYLALSSSLNQLEELKKEIMGEGSNGNNNVIFNIITQVEYLERAKKLLEKFKNGD